MAHSRRGFFGRIAAAALGAGLTKKAVELTPDPDRDVYRAGGVKLTGQELAMMQRIRESQAKTIQTRATCKAAANPDYNAEPVSPQK